MKKLIFALVAIVAAAFPANAQSLWLSANAKYKVMKRLNVSVEAEARSLDELSGVGRWSLSAGVDYKLFKPLKVAAGYAYLRQKYDLSFTRKGNMIPSYWANKHRFYFSLTGELSFHRFTFSLREQYQYTYRQEQTVAKYAADGVTPKPDELLAAKSKNILRSRLEVEYNIRKSHFTPFVSFEIYNSLSNAFDLDKIRYTVGSSYKFNNHHSVELFYRYIDRSDDDDNSNHVIGAGYTFKF
jgi:hypothetical protein